MKTNFLNYRCALIVRAVSFLVLNLVLTAFTVQGQPAANESVSMDNGTAIVRWQGTAGVKYRVERSSALGAPWEGIDAPTTAFAETNILTSPAAFFRVTTWSSAYPNDTSIPSTPHSFTVNVPLCNKVTLSWNAVTDTGGGASGTSEYLIYRGGAFLKSVPHAAGASTFSTDDSSVLAANTYTYQIATMDRAGNVSSPSAAVSVITPACACSYTISPSVASLLGASGGSGSFDVSAASTCAWTATANQPWISIRYTGIGNGTVNYTVDANSSTSSRVGTITVNGQTFTLNQAGNTACSYVLSPPSGSQGTAAGNGSFGVTAEAGCSWSATAGQTWIHTTSSGSGSGTVNYTVDANGGTSPRSGSIVVNGQTFSVSQGGATAVDGESPTATFLAPSDGTALNGQVLLQARLTDNLSLARADFYIDKAGQWILAGTSVSSGIVSTNAVLLDTTTVPNGTHSLLCQAFDAAGNYSYTTMGVSVANDTADAGVSLWLSEVGRPTSTGEAAGNAVKADGQGNVIVVGDFKGSVNFGSVTRTALGGSDIFIGKFGPSGNLLWVQTFGGISDDSAAAVAIDASGNILITGYFFGTCDFGGGPLTSADGIYGSDIFVAKYSSNGTHLWSKRLGGRLGNNGGAGIAVDPAGNVIVAGKIYGEADLGAGLILTRAGSADGFVLKLAGQTGAYLWAKDFGGIASDTVKGVAVDSLGDVVVVGFSYAGIDFGGGLILNLGSADLFLVKYAGADGHYLWSRVAGGPGPDTAEGVAVDANQNIFVTGSYYYTVDLGGASVTAPIDAGIYLAKYNGAGSLQWARGLGYETTSGLIGARGVAVDSAGNVAITGNASGGVDFGSGQATYGDANIYVAKYGPQGGYLWAKRSANLGRCAGYAIATDKDRNVLSTGSIQADVNIDGLLASSPGQQIKSAFLLKISP